MNVAEHGGREAGAFKEGAQRLVREADQWKGSGGTGRFPQRASKPQLIGFPREREPKASVAHTIGRPMPS